MVSKRHFLYKTVNLKNGKYYIGRHSTYNIDDGYLGSGTALVNAIEKYGKENFKRRVLVEVSSSEYLWELEKLYITEEMIKDSMCYNLSYGGQHHLLEMKINDPERYRSHQSKAGKSGAKSFLMSLSDDERKKWHTAGAYAAYETNKRNNIHPFITGEAAVMGGKALAGYIELWNPKSIATNKNQASYIKGDCKRVKKDSDLYNTLISAQWLTTVEHKRKLQSCRAW
jgi:hypothetical protein